MALATQAPGTHGEDRSAASIRMNEDGSFNLLVATVDVAGSSDSLSCQVAAEILGVPLEKIVLSPFDSDVTPFDPGAGSLWTQASGRAVEKAARAVLSQILEVGGKLLGRDPGELYAGGGQVGAKGGRSVTYQEIGLRALYHDQAPIQSTASHVASDAPMSFAAVFAEVLVDTETGLVRVLRILEAIDCGELPNPRTIEAQVEGAVVQALGHTLSERMPVDALGRMLFRSWRDYSLAAAIDVPEITTLLVPTASRSGWLGPKDLAELPVNGPAAAIANAVAHAVGVRIRELPLTPDRVLAALTPRAETSPSAA
jgi:putative selenate reductase molybdopterin-binding subunit